MKANAAENFSEARTPGEILRKVRQERGLTLDEVATQLNLTSTRVSQIEAEQWQQLPGLTFARGYLRLYARLLEMDAEALVEQFNHATNSLPPPKVSSGMLRIEPPRPSFLNVRLFSLIFLVVLGCVGFFWWEARTGADKESSDTQALDWPLLESGGAVEARVEVAHEPPLVLLEAENSSALDEKTSDAEGAAVEAEDNLSGLDKTPIPGEPAVAQTDSAPTTVATLSEGVLNFDFSGECWVEVKDGEGKILFTGILSRADTLELSGALPLEVRIGNAAAAKLRYNGVPVLMEPSTRRLTFGS